MSKAERSIDYRILLDPIEGELKTVAELLKKYPYVSKEQLKLRLIQDSWTTAEMLGLAGRGLLHRILDPKYVNEFLHIESDKHHKEPTGKGDLIDEDGVVKYKCKRKSNSEILYLSLEEIINFTE